MGNKGQSALEAIIALPILLSTFALALMLCYQSGLYFMSSYYGEEALLCAARLNTVSLCETNYRARVSKLLLFQTSLNTKIQKSSRQANLFVTVGLVQFQRSLKLPLEDNLK